MFYAYERLFNAKKQSNKVIAKEMIVIYHQQMRETCSGTTGSGNTNGNACSGCGGNTNNPMFFVGNIADVILYNQVLTSQQVSSVQSYLTAKYGI